MPAAAVVAVVHDGRRRVSGLQGQRDSKMGNLFE